MVLIRARVHPFPSRTRKLSSLLLTILGWRRPGKIGSANTKPRDESRGVCVSITPRPCHSEPVTDVTGVGIRNLLAGNLRKSAGIMRFGNGLPRQSADWLAMTCFFDRLPPRRKLRGFVVSGRVQFGMPAAPSRDRSMGGTMPVVYERAGGRTA